MENNLEKIKKYLDDNGLKYKYAEDEKIFLLNYDLQNIIGIFRIILTVNKDNYVVSAILGNKVPEDKRIEISEYLHRANRGMMNGNFEFDYDSGMISYKTFVNFIDIELSEKVIEESIFVPVLMIKKYGENIIKLMIGTEETPKSLIEKVES